MPDPRRLVLASTDFRPMIGGVADYLHRVAESLAGQASVTVMSSVPSNGAAWEHAYNLRLLPPLPERRLGRRFGDGIPPLRMAHTGAYFLALRRYATAVVSSIRAAGAGDAAVLIGLWDTVSHFWCDACARARVPYGLVAYGLDLVNPLYGRLPDWRRADFARAARVIAVSQATADLASERLQLPRPPAVVNPSVGPRPPAAAIAARAATLRRALDLDGRAGPVLLSVGRLVPRKGFDLALRSVSELQPHYPGLRYIILGGGPERQCLETLSRDLGVASSVRFLGTADEITKWAAYDLCDLFVMPNRSMGGTEWEGFGIVFVEAALAGRPSIAGRSGGTADAVVDEVTGFRVDPEHPGELTAAIRRLVADAGLRVRLGRAGEEMARTRFTSGGLADRMRCQLGWD